uniref:Uncharacterized protein n=1 Tax=Arcella intermedia TaxID=1963864 RepID=A0A6B2LN54_9EUKA
MYTKTIDTKTITWQLQFAETEEELPSDLQEFFNDCEAIILVFSSTSPSSLTKLQAIYDHLASQKRVLTILVETKYDLKNLKTDKSYQDSLEYLIRVLDSEQIYTSALTTYDGMSEINTKLIGLPVKRAKGG